MERKFTDSEIVNYLEEDIQNRKLGYEYFLGQGHYPDEDKVRTIAKVQGVLDLINRQKAEIDRLEVELKAMRGAANSYKAEVERLQKEVRHNYAIRDEACKMLEDLEKAIPTQFAKAKSEAIKEFAERLKKEACYPYVESDMRIVTVDDIDKYR